MGKYKQGFFKPKNPAKYKGDATNIVYRSSYELKMFRHLDSHADVEWWASEEMSIPYFSPIDKRTHRYFPDVIVKKKSSPTIIMIEIKPEVQTRAPKPKMTKAGKPKKTYLREVTEWGKNQAKWEAAKQFCEKNGWEWVIMTEKELGINRKKKK